MLLCVAPPNAPKLKNAAKLKLGRNKLLGDRHLPSGAFVMDTYAPVLDQCFLPRLRLPAGMPAVINAYVFACRAHKNAPINKRKK
jgi:hypothetical protein